MCGAETTMKRAIHFSKVFGIVWILVMAAYTVMVYSVGFGIGFLRWRPSQRTMMFIFWAWPVIPALVLAFFWEGAMVIAKFVKARLAN